MSSEIGIGIGSSLILLLVLLYFSTFESAALNASRLSIRVLAEKHESPRYALLGRLAADRRLFLLPLQLCNLAVLVVVTAVLTVTLTREIGWSLAWSLILTVAVVAPCRLLLPQYLVQGRAADILLGLLPTLRHIYPALAFLVRPLVVGLGLTAKRREEENERDNGDEEITEEEILAYLGVGEEEGIFESSESGLIQSALEFGSTLVREIMTPRNEIVAIEENATLRQLRDLIVSSKHSRIPVYREQLDFIVGVAYVRSLLAHLEPGRENEPITPLVSEVLIIPETKRVYDLMKEMQAKGEQLAIVINEYGTVSGLVTLEDLVEEIVGEIRDEDESPTEDIVYEGEGSYIVRGATEVDLVESVLHVDFGKREAATVSGLVVECAGRVPSPGESVRIDGVELFVLSADGKRIHTLRVRAAAGASHSSAGARSDVDGG